MRRAAAVIALMAGLLVFAVGAVGAEAHPLGNFSINHLVQVKASADRIELRYLLDQAEIPTFQERGRSDAEVIAAKRAEVRRALAVTADGRRVPLRETGPPRLERRPGQGGLPTTRLELSFAAPARGAGRVDVRDGTFPGRVGWRAVVARPGEGTSVRSTAPSTDPTGGLRRYPKDALSSPRDQRTATLEVRPGDGTLTAPRDPGGTPATTAERSGGDGFAGVFADAAAGRGVLLFFLLAALAWGAVHALSPGHGKTMVAAYLVGTRGRARHALALGATVTITHTIGVFALGLVTLALSQYILPEDLYPWLNLVSGLMVLVIGAGVLRSRFRRARRRHHHDHHDHVHGHDHDHEHDLSWKGLVGMGASAGLIPCPSALVVLLAAVSQHEVALGLLLIVAFSLGLAGTLTALGLAVVYAGRATSRLSVPAWVGTALPALSALVIVVAGIALTAKAVPEL
jgi:ABC-type nickel/cobalt efflux system permease component RcnA